MYKLYKCRHCHYQFVFTQENTCTDYYSTAILLNYRCPSCYGVVQLETEIQWVSGCDNLVYEMEKIKI